MNDDVIDPTVLCSTNVHKQRIKVACGRVVWVTGEGSRITAQVLYPSPTDTPREGILPDSRIGILVFQSIGQRSINGNLLAPDGSNNAVEEQPPVWRPLTNRLAILAGRDTIHSYCMYPFCGSRSLNNHMITDSDAVCTVYRECT